VASWAFAAASVQIPRGIGNGLGNKGVSILVDLQED